MSKTPLEVLVGARKLINDKGLNTSGSYYHGGLGCFCTVGAICTSAESEDNENFKDGMDVTFLPIDLDGSQAAVEFIIMAINNDPAYEPVNDEGDVYNWNDENTKECVLETFDRAIDLASGSKYYAK